MRRKAPYLAVIVCFFGLTARLNSQEITTHSVVDSNYVSVKALENLNRKSGHFKNKIESKTLSSLNKLEQLEKKYYRRLYRIDSSRAKELFQNIEGYYNQARAILNQKLDLSKRKAMLYVPWLDSVSTTLKYLEKLGLKEDIKSIPNTEEIGKALGSINGIQEVLGKSKIISKLIDDRKKQLVKQFSELGLLKELRKFQTTAYYYKAQIAEYKTIINEPDQLFAKSIHLLQKVPAFNEFYRRNSVLSQFFRIPGSNSNDPSYNQSLAGLQTRAAVSEVMQQKLGVDKIPGGSQQVDQLLQASQSEINKLKSAIQSKFSGLSADAQEIPDFTPQQVKTKTFLKRLEYGVNIQTQRATAVYPIGTDIGVSLGYKINDKSVIGIGASYSFSWGRDIKHIQIEHKGAGMRSFIEWDIKWGIWLTGGYELNYHSSFEKFSQLKILDAWQHSGLLGISKRIPVKSKYLKYSDIKILWNLLSYREIPRTQPILIRVGYGF